MDWTNSYTLMPTDSSRVVKHLHTIENYNIIFTVEQFQNCKQYYTFNKTNSQPLLKSPPPKPTGKSSSPQDLLQRFRSASFLAHPLTFLCSRSSLFWPSLSVTTSRLLFSAVSFSFFSGAYPCPFTRESAPRLPG